MRNKLVTIDEMIDRLSKSKAEIGGDKYILVTNNDDGTYSPFESYKFYTLNTESIKAFIIK